MPETHDCDHSTTALSDLDIKYRSVVVCRYLLDWSTEETARALDLAARNREEPPLDGPSAISANASTSTRPTTMTDDPTHATLPRQDEA